MVITGFYKKMPLKLPYFFIFWQNKKPQHWGIICFSGGSSGNWTSDTRIFSPLLYRLSYEAKWRFQRDLNPWSLAWQASVIDRYTMEPLVAGEGFEPTTFGLWARRATRLLPSRDINFKLAEEKGFEPLRRSPDLLVFKTSPFNRTWVFLHFFKRNLIIA